MEILAELRKVKFDYVITVPCGWLAKLYDLIERESRISLIRVTREEEGMGIGAGIYLGGKRAAMLIQSGGIGNSVNAIASLLKLYKIPLFLLISHRGDLGEKISAQIPMGQTIIPIFDVLNIPYYEIKEQNEIRLISQAFDFMQIAKKPVVVLLSGLLWG